MQFVRPVLAFAITLAAGAGAVALVVPTGAAAIGVAQSAVVSAVPASYTPNVNNGQVNAIAQSGSTVVLGGTFTSVSPHGSTTTFTANYLTAFTAGTGALVSSFAPTLDGEVESVIPGPTADTVYVGGSFTTIDGVKTKVALISTATGAMVPGWKSPPVNGIVNTMALTGGSLYIGGYFTAVGSASRVGLAVLNATTGAISSVTTPAFVGHHNYGVNCDPTTETCASAGTGVKSIDINPAGDRLVAIGNFTTAAGLPRDQIALLDLAPSSVSVDTSWATAAYTAECGSSSYDLYVRDVQFSPDGSYFVAVATGGGGSGARNTDGTRASCDAAARYETSGSGSDVRPTWIDYAGNDTFLSVATTSTAVYVGGHERWVNNSAGQDSAGEGAVPRPGIVALDPQNGMPLAWNPGRNPRGAGAYSLLATSDGLYVGSDTDYIGNYRYMHAKIAFFPSAGGSSLPSNQAGTLPGTVYLLGSGTSAATARAVSWDGSSAPGTPSTVTSVDWTTARGAFEINNEVYYGDTDGNFSMRSFDGSTFGPAIAIDPYDDPAWDTVLTGSGQTYQGTQSAFYSELPSLTSMFYSNGRVYYTLAGNTHMHWRWFEPNSGVMGADEFTTTDTVNWSNVSGAFLSGSTLYYADSTTKDLYGVSFVNGQASGTPTLRSSAIDWTSSGAFIATRPPTAPSAPAAPTALSEAGAVSVSWSPPAHNGGDAVVGYNIQYSSNGGATWASASAAFNHDPATTQTVAGLVNGTSYQFRVAAINAVGTGSYSSASTPVRPFTTPGVPTGIHAVAGDAQVTLSWTAPSDTGGDPILGYDIQYSTPAGLDWESASASFHTNASTTEVVDVAYSSSGYVFRLAALTAAGMGSYSDPSATVIPTIDSTGIVGAATATVTYGQLVHLTATLSDTTSGEPLDGLVELQSRTTPSAAFAVVSKQQTANFQATASVRPTVNTQYRWYYPQTAKHQAAWSQVERVSVAPVVTMAHVATRTHTGKAVKFYGTVSPSAHGQLVYLQRRLSRHWSTLKTKASIRVQSLPNGKRALSFVLSVQLTQKGVVTYRVYRPATTHNSAGYSHSVTVRLS